MARGQRARGRRARGEDARARGDDDARRRDRARDEDERTLDAQLRALSLERRVVEADGNCFFRALADQRYGDEARHAEVRAAVVARVAARRDDFAPFVEDDEDFDAYVERMARDGEWAGHLEVNAATAVLGVGICIHQSGSPRWVAGAEASDERARTYHVSYEGSDHYNSVRLRGGKRDGPGGPMSLALLRDEDLCELARRTGCTETERLRRALRACRNDVDSAADVIEEEIEGETRAREKAIDEGVDVEEFDGGDWAEVKTKNRGGSRSSKKGNARNKRGGSREEVDLESLGI